MNLPQWTMDDTIYTLITIGVIAVSFGGGFLINWLMYKTRKQR